MWATTRQQRDYIKMLTQLCSTAAVVRVSGDTVLRSSYFMSAPRSTLINARFNTVEVESARTFAVRVTRAPYLERFVGARAHTHTHITQFIVTHIFAPILMSAHTSARFYFRHENPSAYLCALILRQTHAHLMGIS